MLRVDHAGQTFEAKGNTVFVGEEHYVLIGDVVRMESWQGHLFVDTDCYRYEIVGIKPREMYAMRFPEAE